MGKRKSIRIRKLLNKYIYMELTAGWLKDAIAAIYFLTGIILIRRGLNKKRYFVDILLIGLLLCFTIDFTFTINPEYHNTEIGYNRPTYITILIGITGLLIGLRYIK
tara:strand:+ start:1324 stop:1644 length:321 start_codon:yes stop_codon:yes gene_type:complete